MWVSLSAWLALGAVAGASSVPHCVGMCGPLAAAACPKGAGAAAPLRYQAGRVVSYAALGAIAGALGHTLRWGLPGAWGSALLSWALAAGLVDEVQLWVWPILLGGRNPALPTDRRIDLELVDEHRFANGVVHLRYSVG